MRVPNRAVKRPLIYTLELMEQRVMLSAAVPPALAAAFAAVPTHWQAHPALYRPIKAGETPAAGGTTSPVGVITPSEMEAAYGVNALTINGGIVGNGAGQTIGIVDAYDYPTAYADLQAFDAAFGLPNPPSFVKLNDQGNTAPLPTTDPAGAGSLNGTWEEEESLDIEWAHVIAPGASIDLFEANSDFGNDLFVTAAAAARTPGVSVVSMSWSGDESSAETAMDATFTTPANHEGVTFVAAAGDNGIYDPFGTVPAPQYPAASPNVVAAGGTTLTVSGNGYGGEVGWGNGTNSSYNGGGGGGISQYEPQPAYQRLLVTQSSAFRTYPDVAMDADPASGVATYDSYDYGSSTPWDFTDIGGTSLATPMFAAVVAIADQERVASGATTLDGPSQTLPRLYDLPDQDYHDITNGNNGYQAGIGYDLVTGRGSPVGTSFVPDLASNYIGSYVFNDSNINGIQDPGESGAPGVTADLMTPGPDGIIGTADDLTVATTTTDSSGLYDFTNLAGGNYYVHFVIPAGSTFSPQGTSTVVTANSNVNPLTGNTPLITVTAGSEYELANGGIYQQTISINDVTITRPHSGLAPMVFTVTLAPVNLQITDVQYNTTNVTAIANTDYIATSGTLIFPVGVTTETITVNAVGNLTIENNVTFNVNISTPPNFVGVKTVGVGTILNSNFPVATVSGSSTQTRSATLSLSYPFVISLSAPAPFEVAVPYTTMDQSATAGVDYIAAAGTAAFPPGTTSETITVTANPGTNPELSKTFIFELTVPPSPATETVGTPSQATGTILTNSPPQVSAAPGSVTESPTGLAYLPFEVNVGPALSSSFTISYTTIDGTAVAGTDYKAVAGVLSFGPGQIQQTVYVPVYRQFIPQQQKTLSLSIFNPSSTLDLVTPLVSGTINYLTLTALPFSAAKRVVYTDALNQRVTVSLQGAGSGDVVFLGSVSNATNAYEILVDNTDGASSLSVKLSRGEQTSLTNMIISSPIGTINAKTTNIVGSFSAAGSVASLNLGYVDGAIVTIGGAGSGQSVDLNFNRVLNSSITSAISIKSLTAGAYVDTTGSPIYITAPSVGVVKVKGTFGGTISTSTIKALEVGGTIDGGGVLTTGSIGTITANAITNSRFFAGVNAGQTTLPASESDFTGSDSEIQAVSVRGGVFSNSLIAGWTVGNVSVGKVTTQIGAANFGVSADHVGKVHAIAGTTRQIVQLANPVKKTAVENFVVTPI